MRGASVAWTGYHWARVIALLPSVASPRESQRSDAAGRSGVTSGPAWRGLGAVPEERHDDRGGVAGVVQHLLFGGAQAGSRCDGFTGAEVPGVARVGGTRDLEPDAMACLEAVGGWPERDRDAPRSVRLAFECVGAETANPVADVLRCAAAPGHVAKTGDEVRMLEARADEELRPGLADDVDVGR